MIRKRVWPTTIKTFRTKRDALDWAKRTEDEMVRDVYIDRAGLSSMHGLRHAYAQERYEELTDWHCPAQGGPNHTTLNPEQRELDHEARMTISQELGHEREQVTAAYLGR